MLLESSRITYPLTFLTLFEQYNEAKSINDLKAKQIYFIAKKRENFCR